jgi:DNA-directed RNA polymerase specialized sigma24 family protein
MASSKDRPLDQDLVQRCLAGNDQAWERIKELIQRISLFRVYRGKHSEEAEETADEVILALWRGNCHLLRGFEPGKGNLENYLTAVVKHIAEQDERLKQRERGKLREYKRRHRSPADRELEESPRLIQEEFAKRLKGELKRYFLQEYLGRLEKGKRKKYSKAYAWKLDQRLTEEWRRYRGS